jgi:CRP-like cAMP-binding protein
VGGELTVGYVRPGEVFGEVSVITAQPRRSFAEASRRSRILAIPRDVFLRALSSSKPLFEVTKQMGERLIRWQSRAEDLVFCDARTRLARLLLRLADEFGDLESGGVTVGLGITQEEMATLIGATRQTVSVAVREMIRAKLITRRGRSLVIVDRDALRQSAGLARATGERV